MWRPRTRPIAGPDSAPWPAPESNARRVLEDVLDDGVEVCVAVDHA
jgi:hypothetical protein